MRDVPEAVHYCAGDSGFIVSGGRQVRHAGKCVFGADCVSGKILYRKERHAYPSETVPGKPRHVPGSGGVYGMDCGADSGTALYLYSGA